MALADYYERGVRDWTDQPECVDPTIRPLCIALNDVCEDGEREALIGPHMWAPIGTRDDSLQDARLRLIVRFALDRAADALDVAGIEHGLRAEFADYKAAEAAARAAARAAYAAAMDVGAHRAAARAAAVASNAAAAAPRASEAWADALAFETARAAVETNDWADTTDRNERLLALILELCAMSTPLELPGAVTRAEALRVVCGVEA